MTINSAGRIFIEIEPQYCGVYNEYRTGGQIQVTAESKQQKKIVCKVKLSLERTWRT